MAIRDQQFNPGTMLMKQPKLVVGLGNIGEKYENTRHNAGFLAVDAHAGDVTFANKPNLDANIFETTFVGTKLIYAKPATMMNESGRAVMKIQNYYGVNDPDILIIYDDVDLDFGTVRIRSSGSSGGHNGIKSIEKILGQDFKRIRIGVKNEFTEKTDTARFVLKPFSSEEQKKLPTVFEATNKCIEDFLHDNFEDSTSRL